MTRKPLDELTAVNVSSSNDDQPHQELYSQFTEAQLIVIGIWLGLPIVAFLLVWIINPVYESEFFAPDFNLIGTALLIGSAVAEIINALTLFFGFRLINHFLPVNNKSRRVWRATLISLLSILTFFLFTLQILLIILLGPAAIVIARRGS
jgi:hypothetical protein